MMIHIVDLMGIKREIVARWWCGFGIG